jgi:hypothetical protein
MKTLSRILFARVILATLAIYNLAGLILIDLGIQKVLKVE